MKFGIGIYDPCRIKLKIQAWIDKNFKVDFNYNSQGIFGQETSCEVLAHQHVNVCMWAS